MTASTSAWSTPASASRSTPRCSPRTLRPGHPVLTVEDHSVTNGFGTAVAEHAVTHGLPTADLHLLGHPADRLVAHAKREAQLAEVGLDAAGIAESVRRARRREGRAERAEQPGLAVELVTG